jgi:hypothetical protein
MLPSSSSRAPLRREAGEREGPIAKQWEGEVVLLACEIFPGVGTAPTSPSPRSARIPALSPHVVGGEGV